MDALCAAAAKMNLKISSLDILQQKEGVTVARLYCDGGPCIIKVFDRKDFCREIDNYRLLASLGIPTLRVIDSVDNALLLEDILQSNRYRLGIKEDLDSSAVARLAARWYRLLHQKGREYMEQNSGKIFYEKTFYDENAALTRDNIAEIRQKTDTARLSVWRLIDDNFARIRGWLDSLNRTLTYNDFYYTNLAVAGNGDYALMFDYNLLGRGYAYADIRNVCASLSEEAGQAFCEEYGEYDPAEKAVDDVVSVLLTLHSACRKNSFPSWARGSLEEIKSRDYLYKVERLLSLEQPACLSQS